MQELLTLPPLLGCRSARARRMQILRRAAVAATGASAQERSRAVAAATAPSSSMTAPWKGTSAVGRCAAGWRPLAGGSSMAPRLSHGPALFATPTLTVRAMACRLHNGCLFASGGLGMARGAALRHSRATAKSRSLSPDDPFGERSSWEDPSDGIYAPWHGVDEDGFVAAAESAEVRHTHFGPTWSRFTTTGRMAVKKMREDPRHRDQAEGRPSAYPTAEQVHAAELASQRRLMAHNYATYEEYLAAELGGSPEDDAAAVEAVPRAGQSGSSLRSPSAAPIGDGDDVYAEAAMERAFAVAADGVDRRDRMAQRSPERAALQTAEAAAAGFDEAAELPAFMATAGDNGEPRQSVESRLSDVPESLVSAVLRALPQPHGDAALPLVDPARWATEDIVAFLQRFEQQPEAGGSVMDDSMVDAFRLARVDGAMLLDVVTPPRLFRALRRWHNRRVQIISRARAAQQRDGLPDDAAAARVVAEGAPLLAEAVAPVTPLLIQETILLCFPYAR